MNPKHFKTGNWFAALAILFLTTPIWIALAWIALANGSLALIIAGLCLGLFGLVSWLGQRPAQQQPVAAPNDELISIVAMYETLPFIDEPLLAAHVNRAWGVEMQNIESAESFVVGSAPLFVIKTPHQIYVVNYFDNNYFENLDEVLDEITELRVSNVIRRHRAWISVDLVSDSQNLAPCQHYSMIGQLLSQLTNNDCVALLIPDQMKLIPWDESAQAALISKDPLANLCPSQPPVIPIDDDYPKLVAAVEVARNRFSQFVTAFENHQRNEDRDESDQFAVKAPISMGGRTEFMWINTTAIENGILYGTLGNRPVGLSKLRPGDRVRVRVSEINDWIYTQGNRPFGGFTTKVIAQWARDQNACS